MTRSHSICGTKDEKLEKRVEKKTGGGGEQEKLLSLPEEEEKGKGEKGYSAHNGSLAGYDFLGRVTIIKTVTVDRAIVGSVLFCFVLFWI